MTLAICSIRAGIKFTTALAFKGQELKWSDASRRLYRTILENSLCSPIIISEGPCSAQKMFQRDEWMVDRGTEIIACWDGTENGGTYKTVCFAQQKKKIIHRINHKELKW